MNASVFASLFGEDALAAFEKMSIAEQQNFFLQRVTRLEEEKQQERAAKELAQAKENQERAAKELAQAKERISTVFTRLTNSSPPTLDQYHQLVEDVDFVCAETGLTLNYASDEGRQTANDDTPSSTPAGSKKSTSQVTQQKETLPNGFSKIRRANLACDFDVRRWVLSNDDLHQIVLETLFDKDEQKKNTFLEQQCESLNSFRRVLLYCRSRNIAIREVNDVQPMFHAFLVLFLFELGQHEHRTVIDVNSVRLSMELSFLTTENTHEEKRINGFSDIAVYATTSDSNTPKDWSHVFEMKVCFNNLIKESGGRAEDQTIVQLAAVQGAHLREEFSTNSATDPDSSSSSSASTKPIPVALAQAPLPISTIEHTIEQDAAAPSNDLPRALEAQAPTKMVLRSHTALERAPSSSLLPTPACSPASTTNSSTKEVPRSSINEAKIDVLGALTDIFELRIACALSNDNGENVFFLSDRVSDASSFVLRIAFLFCEPDAILQHVLRCGDESLDIKCCNSSSPEETKSTKSASQGPSKSGGTNKTKAAEDQCRGFYRWSARAHHRAISPQHMDSDSDDSENTIDMFDEESDVWFEMSALRQWSRKLYEDVDRGVY